MVCSKTTFFIKLIDLNLFHFKYNNLIKNYERSNLFLVLSLRSNKFLAPGATNSGRIFTPGDVSYLVQQPVPVLSFSHALLNHLLGFPPYRKFQFLYLILWVNYLVPCQQFLYVPIRGKSHMDTRVIMVPIDFLI